MKTLSRFHLKTKHFLGVLFHIDMGEIRVLVEKVGVQTIFMLRALVEKLCFGFLSFSLFA